MGPFGVLLLFGKWGRSSRFGSALIRVVFRYDSVEFVGGFDFDLVGGASQFGEGYGVVFELILFWMGFGWCGCVLDGRSGSGWRFRCLVSG